MSNDSTFNQLLVKFGLDVLTGNKKSAQTAVESIVDVIGTGSAEGSWTRGGPFPSSVPANTSKT
jgi:hypothetical protein